MLAVSFTAPWHSTVHGIQRYPVAKCILVSLTFCAVLVAVVADCAVLIAAVAESRGIGCIIQACRIHPC